MGQVNTQSLALVCLYIRLPVRVGPRLSGKVSSLSDLPSSVTAGSLLTTRINPYMEMTP